MEIFYLIIKFKFNFIIIFYFYNKIVIFFQLNFNHNKLKYVITKTGHENKTAPKLEETH